MRSGGVSSCKRGAQQHSHVRYVKSSICRCANLPAEDAPYEPLRWCLFWFFFGAACHTIRARARAQVALIAHCLQHQQMTSESQKHSQMLSVLYWKPNCLTRLKRFLYDFDPTPSVPVVCVRALLNKRAPF